MSKKSANADVGVNMFKFEITDVSNSELPEEKPREEYALPCVVRTRFRKRAVRGEELFTEALERFKKTGQQTISQINSATKHTATPAQEATRAQIQACESQLKKLYRIRTSGKLDYKGAEEIRILEENMRKAHSKLRRLLTEAQRQRRRRERLKRGLSPASPSACVPSSRLFMALTSGESTNFSSPYPSCQSISDGFLITPKNEDGSIMAAIKKCDKFEDVAQELLRRGYCINSICNSDTQAHCLSQDDDDLPISDDPTTLLEQSMEESPSVPSIPPISIKKESTPLTTASTTAEEIIIEPQPESDTNNGFSSEHVKKFADEYARKYAQFTKDLQSQYQEWYQQQVELQRQQEETFMREQLETIKTVVEGATGTFLHGIQQMMESLLSHVCRRPMEPFVPTFARNWSVPPENAFFNSDENAPIFVMSEQ